MENLSRMNDPEFELWFCQFLLDRDNSLSDESGRGSDLETSGDEEDAVPEEVVVDATVPEGVAVDATEVVPDGAAVPCCACCPLLKDNPVASCLWGWRNYSSDA